jgi:hypothetical protein
MEGFITTYCYYNTYSVPLLHTGAIMVVVV